MPQPHRQYVRGRWGQLHLHLAAPVAASDRPPLVCFHLSPGSSRMFRPFLAEMSNDRTAIAVDTPGYGESDPPPAPTTLQAYAETLASVLDELGTVQVDLFGAHTGSRLAVEIAHLRPQQVRRLILYGAAIYTEEERARQKAAFARPKPISPDGSHLADRWTGWASWRWDGVTDEMIGRYAADSVRDFERHWWAHQAVFEHDMGARLSSLSQEVLVLCARDDIEEPTRRARDAIRRGRYLERLDWGHWFLEVDPIGAATVVRGFLDSEDGDDDDDAVS
jgi:pimeloyl-ACP methyl ester carboxylesterase